MEQAVARLNEAVAVVRATSIKDLDTTRTYTVTALRLFETQKYGQKIVADLDGGTYIYVPAGASRHLQKNPNEFLLLQEAANKYKLVIKPLGGYQVKFEIV